MSANDWESRVATLAVLKTKKLVEQMTESPIEAAFVGEMLCSGWEIVERWLVTLYLGTAERAIREEWMPPVILLRRRPFAYAMTQAPLPGIGRVDLLVCAIGVPNSLVVELDGHDFHERTKTQAQRDRSRDRAAVAEGFRVVRFTGSEIHRDTAKCVLEMNALTTPKPAAEASR